LTFLTFATSLFFNCALVGTLAWLDAHRLGVLRLLGLPPAMVSAIAVVILDFSFYVAHRAMHWSTALWRYHRVHHAAPVVDVTTTTRHHPGEGVIRYAFMTAFAVVLGVSPGAFAIYRVWSVLNGLVEHANVRLPRWLDRRLAWVVTSPDMHKIHHSRVPSET